VIVVIFSSGEMSNPLLKEKVIINTRIKETKKVGKFLGVKETILLGIADRKIANELKNKETIEKVDAIIKKYKPDRVFTHSPSDLHKDHRIVFKIVDKVMKNYKEIGMYTFNVWNPMSFTRRNVPKLYVDITDYFDKKMKALEIFESQKGYVYSLLPLVVFKSLIHGRNVEGRYAEKFDKLR